MNIVTVCLDTAGTQSAKPHIEATRAAANGQLHPMLFDPGHVVGEIFGMINVPSSVWIDEAGNLVRPAEPAWPSGGAARSGSAPDDLPPGRMGALMAAAARIVADRDSPVGAIRDWAKNGAQSPYALGPEEVTSRSDRRGIEEATAAAHFELATHLHSSGDHDAAIAHFRASHELYPDNWTYRRQAWSMQTSAIEGPLERFWQGPIDGKEADWPYPGDWVSDIEKSGPENYYRPFKQ